MKKGIIASIVSTMALVLLFGGSVWVVAHAEPLSISEKDFSCIEEPF